VFTIETIGHYINLFGIFTKDTFILKCSNLIGNESNSIDLPAEMDKKTGRKKQSRNSIPVKSLTDFYKPNDVVVDDPLERLENSSFFFTCKRKKIVKCQKDPNHLVHYDKKTGYTCWDCKPRPGVLFACYRCYREFNGNCEWFKKTDKGPLCRNHLFE
jgi:hypothetical protein